jgi:hypothetical protein
MTLSPNPGRPAALARPTQSAADLPVLRTRLRAHLPTLHHATPPPGQVARADAFLSPHYSLPATHCSLPFFSTTSELPLRQPLSFDNHTKCPGGSNSNANRSAPFGPHYPARKPRRIKEMLHTFHHTPGWGVYGLGRLRSWYGFRRCAKTQLVIPNGVCGVRNLSFSTRERTN